MAKIIDLLCFAEVDIGGPYGTWLASDSRWIDVDPVVNSNIGYFLKKCGVELPALIDYLDRQTLNGALESKYYQDLYAVYYFMTRYHDDVLTERCTEWLLAALVDSENILYQAQLISTLIRSGDHSPEIKRAITKLMRSQRPDGSWPAVGLYVDAHIDETVVYAGADALTTAFCIEAIDLYEKTLQAQSEKANIKAGHACDVLARVREVIADVSSFELRDDVNQILNNTLDGNSERHIIELPFIIEKALGVQKIDQEIVKDLSTMSLWGWLAYTAQDDCMDGGLNLDKIPASNFCMRKLLESLDSVAAMNSEFRGVAECILQAQDSANAWELRHCRVPLISPGIIEATRLPDYGDYQQLADKSLGHVISALGVLYAGGFTIESGVISAMKTFMSHYLIARQLNDDAHDWEYDLRIGHINSVAARVLHKYILTHPIAGAVIDLNTQSEMLQKMLWEQEIVYITRLILTHLESARSSLQEIPELDYETLNELLLPIEKAAHKSLNERQKVLDLINHLY